VNELNAEPASLNRQTTERSIVYAGGLRLGVSLPSWRKGVNRAQENGIIGMSLKLRKERFVGPGENRGFAWVVLPFSFFIFAYSTQFGQIPILLLYALWFPLLAFKPGIVLLRTARLIPFLLMPAFAAFSTFWSAAPSLTLRTAIQYATTILIAAIAARTIDPRDLVVGALLGTVLVLGYSFLNGSWDYDVFDATYGFSGAFSSKNQFGLFAAIGLLAALAALTLYRSSASLSAFVSASLARSFRLRFRRLARTDQADADNDHSVPDHARVPPIIRTGLS
jgi:hypothetical protein